MLKGKLDGGWSYPLSGLVILGFAIQILGISLTDHNLNPILVPVPLLLYWVGNVEMGVSIAAPLLSFAALKIVRADVKQTPIATEKRIAHTTAIVAVVISLPECFWTLSGHPTWYQGFGR